MKNFSLDDKVTEAYTTEQYAPRPVIGITANHEGLDATLREAYCKQVVRAGGVPVIIPAIDDADVIAQTLDNLDAVILSGGGDHNPLWMGEQPSPRIGNINAVRDSAELLLTRMAYNRNLPMLGICRGMQTLAVALGGHVRQDISNVAGIKHSQTADRQEPTHSISLCPETIVWSLYHEADSINVNSFHHQAIDSTGERFNIAATSPDGLIEAMESSENRNIIGVQWHPEWLSEDGLPLFAWLVSCAKMFRQARSIHRHILSVDSHCDTPMFFHQGVDFLKRDPRILVDLHKMREGMLDATTMVCYLPQPWTPTNGASPERKGKSFGELNLHGVESPCGYADYIFNKIEEIESNSNNQIGIIRTYDDLVKQKEKGKKSIFLGIENGFALANDAVKEPSLDEAIANLRHFQKRGIVYITLCHNGDNFICDSARGNNTHGGLSPLGKNVIREMNRLGIMVDLSHANINSFNDALRESSAPIVCSHSNCRTLCDHPRNLTDDQMQRLAEKGGLMQLTLYSGFLKKDGEASILDFINHLEYAISIMGIDHVGIGTDFDGDGGVKGFADASDCLNLTMHLLRLHHSEDDLQKIWGGNWLRVMREVQRMER